MVMERPNPVHKGSFLPKRTDPINGRLREFVHNTKNVRVLRALRESQICFRQILRISADAVRPLRGKGGAKELRTIHDVQLLELRGSVSRSFGESRTHCRFIT